MSFRWDGTPAGGAAGAADSSEGAPGLGTHGSGSPQELRCTLIASGPSFRQGMLAELPSGNVDVAPTVLRLLGVTAPAPLDGRPLTEALRDATDAVPAVGPPAVHEARCELGDGPVTFRAVVERAGATRYVASLSAERA
jgi:arylsulfatase A-like enzyme